MSKSSEASVTAETLVSQADIRNLRSFILKARKRGDQTTHNTVMLWLDGKPKVMESFRRNGIIKAYGAYVLEFGLGISETILK